MICICVNYDLRFGFRNETRMIQYVAGTKQRAVYIVQVFHDVRDRDRPHDRARPHFVPSTGRSCMGHTLYL